MWLASSNWLPELCCCDAQAAATIHVSGRCVGDAAVATVAVEAETAAGSNGVAQAVSQDACGCAREA